MTTLENLSHFKVTISFTTFLKSHFQDMLSFNIQQACLLRGMHHFLSEVASRHRARWPLCPLSPRSGPQVPPNTASTKHHSHAVLCFHKQCQAPSSLIPWPQQPTSPPQPQRPWVRGRGLLPQHGPQAGSPSPRGSVTAWDMGIILISQMCQKIKRF